MPFQFPTQKDFYRGKVRDVYTFPHDIIVLVASDRISAFDVILPKPIPYKGQVLNQIAAEMLHATKHICPNWLLTVPAPNASLGRKCIPLKVEVVVRGNLCGHAWRTYSVGHRILCGVLMPDGMKENDFFPEPIITPSTKASQGHDEDITEQELIQENIVTPKQWDTIKLYALALFKEGNQIARSRGLILADTKYEFGLLDQEITLMDEIHTPDSSRYFYSDGFEERQKSGEKQKQLSKEFVREWLIEHHFMGHPGETVPEMTEDWVNVISSRYIELYEKVTGKNFQKITISDGELYAQILSGVENVSR